MSKRITDGEVLDIIESNNPLKASVEPNPVLNNGQIDHSKQEIYDLLCRNKNLTRATCWVLFAARDALEELREIK